MVKKLPQIIGKNLPLNLYYIYVYIIKSTKPDFVEKNLA